MRLAIVALALAGCAGVTDVVSTGPETYMVASHGTMGWSSGPAQKAKAFQMANEFCAKKGKLQAEGIKGNTTGSGYGQIASAEVEFRCVPA